MMENREIQAVANDTDLAAIIGAANESFISGGTELSRRLRPSATPGLTWHKARNANEKHYYTFLIPPTTFPPRSLRPGSIKSPDRNIYETRNDNLNQWAAPICKD